MKIIAPILDILVILKINEKIGIDVGNKWKY